MEENKFWFSLWAMVGTVFSTIVIASLVYFSHKNGVMLDVVAKGADPMEVKCAFDRNETDAEFCTILAMKKGNE